MGSMEEARRSGMKHACKAQKLSAAIPLQDADGGGIEHQPEDIGASGSEGHANAEFIVALRHSIRDDAVQADGGEPKLGLAHISIVASMYTHISVHVR